MGVYGKKESIKFFQHPDMIVVEEGEEIMDPNETKCQTTDPTLCSECDCSRDPEDALLDLSKMTPEEKRDYLYELLRNRSFGCCG